MAYNPLTYEKSWEVQTAEKGTRYAVVRAQGKGDVAFAPYGLTRDCKALATMLSATPDLLRAVEALLTAAENLRYDSLPEDVVAKARAAISKATLQD